MRQQSGWLGLCLVLPLAMSMVHAQTTPLDPRWELGPTGSKAGLRGLSVPREHVVWACGSQATVLRSVDAGSSWSECGPGGYGDLEFRSIHAFSEKRVCIASAGTPAVILLTEDAGQSWRVVHRQESEAAFFDALRFWDAHRGLAFSDPVNGCLLVVESSDGGRTWAEIEAGSLPQTLPGEAGFAASNSSLALGAHGKVWIGTGGATSDHSRVHMRTSWGGGWSVAKCPLPSDLTKGIFSIATHGDELVAVGGDYRPEAESPVTVAISTDNGQSWQPASGPPSRYRSAVLHVSHSRSSLWLATGPEGSDYSTDGRDWTTFSSLGFHALAAHGDEVYAVGATGRFALLRLDADRAAR